MKIKIVRSFLKQMIKLLILHSKVIDMESTEIYQKNLKAPSGTIFEQLEARVN